MSKAQLIEKLQQLAVDSAVAGADRETIHINADTLLLDFIHDFAVTAAFYKIKKWYA